MERRYLEPKEVLKRLSHATPKHPFGLQLLTRGIYNALLAMPMPWEDKRTVKVVYYYDGSISLISDNKRRLGVEEFKERWTKIQEESGGKVKIIEKSLKREKPKTRSLSVDEIGDKKYENKKDGEKKDGQNYGCALEYCAVHSYKKNSIKRVQKGIASEVLKRYLYPWKGRKKHPVNIPLRPLRLSSSRLKRYRNKLLKRKIVRGVKSKYIASLLRTPYFFQTEMEWKEAVEILLREGTNLINRVLYIKKLSFVSIDNHFNVYFNRTVTGKERKKGRTGSSIRLQCDFLKLLRYVYDAYVTISDCNDLNRTLKYIFCNVGKLTGMYRWKYKISRQIYKCKEMGNRNEWISYWQVWCHMLRGYIPLLEKYSKGLLERLINKREVYDLKPTKQRVESELDIDIKERIKERYGHSPRLLQHFNEKWRCWKRGVEYEPKDEDGMVPGYEINRILEPFCDIKREWYLRTAKEGKPKTKREVKKRRGKLVRLYIMNEKFRQAEYLKEPFISIERAVQLYKTLAEYTIGHKILDLPGLQHEYILIRTLERLKNEGSKKERDYYKNIKRDKIYNSIRKRIITQRSFEPLEIKHRESSPVYPLLSETPICYKNEPSSFEENLTDAFLEEYLWDNLSKVFPEYSRSFFEHPFEAIATLGNIEIPEPSLVLQLKYQNTLEHIDFSLLRLLLRLLLSPVIVDYIIARINTKIEYKNMSVTNVVGIPHSFRFVSFVHALWLFSLNLCYFSSQNILLQYSDTLFIAVKSLQEITHILSSFPACFGGLVLEKCSSSPSLHFLLRGFDVLQECRLSEKKPGKRKIPHIRIGGSKRIFRVQAEKESVLRFKLRTKQIVMSARGLTFLRVADMWNALLAEYTAYYRETARIYDVRETEGYIQRAIMAGINTKQSSRFPLQLFYGCRAMGGLGMVSFGVSKTKALLKNPFEEWVAKVYEKNPIRLSLGADRIYRIKSPSNRSSFVSEHASLRARRSQRLLTPSFQGIPVDYKRHTLSVTAGLTSEDDIAQLWTTPSQYRKKSKTFLIPNRRFILWWSPVINTPYVSLGYKQQIELTGISLFGKLPSLKLLFVQIFREKLWKKLYERLLDVVGSSFSGCRVITLPYEKNVPYSEHIGLCLRIEGVFDLQYMSGDSECETNLHSERPAFENILNVGVRIVWGGTNNKSLHDVAFNDYAMLDPKTRSFVVVLDILYLRWAFCGYIDKRRLLDVTNNLNLFLSTDKLIQILKERVCNALSIRTVKRELLDVEVYSSGYVLETCNKGLFILNTKNGNLYFRYLNDDEKKSERYRDVITKFVAEVVRGCVVISQSIYSLLNPINGLTLLVYKEPLCLFQLLRITPTRRLKKVQNVYFPSTSSYTSFVRLVTLLRSYKEKEVQVSTNIKYEDGSWTALSPQEWAHIEKATVCQDAPYLLYNTESAWKEDFNEAITRLIAFDLGSYISRKEPFIQHGALLEYSQLDQADNSESSFSSAANEDQVIMTSAKVLEIPINIVECFRAISNTKQEVRGYVVSLSPFTVSILPQFLDTFVEPSTYIGIVSNMPRNLYKELEVIISNVLLVRGWCNNAYVPISAVCVETQGVFLSCDWNFNFRIPIFSTNYTLVEETPRRYYSEDFRPSHFREWYDKVDKSE